MEKRLDGRTVVITGASSGFGKGAARKFAALGANVVLAARREILLDELVLECERLGVKAVSVPTDVSCRHDVLQLANDALAAFGKINVWINNAGAAAIGDFTRVPLDDHEQVINTDLLGTIYGSYVALQQFKAQGFGTLINVSSMIGRIPAPYYASYAAAKHGVLGLSGALRQELAEQKFDDIHVCTVLPMAMDTPFFEHAANYTGHEAKPIPPLNDAMEVVDTFVNLVFHPKAEAAVGRAGALFSVLDSLAPGMTEAMMAKNTSKAQITDAPIAPPTPGAVQQPSSKGTDVHQQY